MTKRLTKFGNSTGIVLDKTILDLLKIPPDSEVEIETDGKRIILTPVRGKSSMRPQVRAAHEAVMKEHFATFRKLAK
jgi:antitoxin MazE